MKITADRRLNPLLAAILVGLAAGWTVSAVSAASYARRYAPEFSWVKKALHLPTSKRKHVSQHGEAHLLA